MDEKTREFLYKLFELEPLLKELKADTTVLGLCNSANDAYHHYH